MGNTSSTKIFELGGIGTGCIITLYCQFCKKLRFNNHIMKVLMNPNTTLSMIKTDPKLQSLYDKTIYHISCMHNTCVSKHLSNDQYLINGLSGYNIKIIATYYGYNDDVTLGQLYNCYGSYNNYKDDNDNYNCDVADDNKYNGENEYEYNGENKYVNGYKNGYGDEYDHDINVETLT